MNDEKEISYFDDVIKYTIRRLKNDIDDIKRKQAGLIATRINCFGLGDEFPKILLNKSNDGVDIVNYITSYFDRDFYQISNLEREIGAINKVIKALEDLKTN